MSRSLRVAILHYHLKRGGVTRIIESTLSGFQSLGLSVDLKIFTGDIPNNFGYKGEALTVPSLRYDNAQATPPTAETLFNEVTQAAKQAFGTAPDIWHIHNHSLGKNSAVSGLVNLLVAEKAALLLQMHDFAEDGRPENYTLLQNAPAGCDQLYPISDRIHYAVLNQRDHRHFLQTGVPTKQLHTLPNPVEGAPAENNPATTQAILNKLGAKELCLYPVRALRRKNFGEMLLWAACAESGQVFANTLGPTNENYQAAYNDWRGFANELKLPVHFSIGEANSWSFPKIVAAANAILTTSIAEGFGMGFLEPWLFDKPIIGRDLPEITADFKRAGLQLETLYSSLPIPEEWIDLNALKRKLQTGLEGAYAAYQIPLPANAAERALAAIQQPNGIDFGGLDESLQKQVITHVCKDKDARQHLRQFLNLPTNEDSASRIHNRTICEQHYSLRAYTENLHLLYQELIQTNESPTKYLDAKALLKTFLQPENFRLLRT
jgi:hypothetical protein